MASATETCRAKSKPPKKAIKAPKRRPRVEFPVLESTLAARLLWLEAKEAADLLAVETYYVEKMGALKAARDPQAPLSEEEVDIREKLILLLIQSGRAAVATKGLQLLGYEARLASCVLAYEPRAKTEANSGRPAKRPPCIVADNAVPRRTADALHAAFSPVHAPYWTSHGYCVEPPSPYYSYVVPLEDVRAGRMGPLGELIETVMALGLERFGQAAMEDMAYAELWAHNRPHASGHQLHYDSDDEGRGGIRHPTVTSVTFIDGSVGGPTLMTNQQLGDNKLATHGWLCFAKSNRVLVFDGRYLHGVVPGKGVSPCPGGRRVTVMIALWRNIVIRDNSPGECFGSARRFPMGPTAPLWAKQLTTFLNETVSNASSSPPIEYADVKPLPAVWERVDSTPWPAEAVIPSYDAVFQGF